MKKILIILIIGVAALSYFGIIDINKTRVKQVLTNGGKAAAAQVKKIDKDKISNAARQVKETAMEVAAETKKEYHAN